MIIATYFQPVPGINEDEQRELIAMFYEAWGDVTVCNFGQAQYHPRFNEMTEMLESYPEVTTPGYRDQCFFRWLAFDMARFSGPLLLMDYDVFPVRKIDLTKFAETFARPTVLDSYANPCCVFLPDAGFLSEIIDMLFLPTEPQNEPTGPHIGDNAVFCQHWQAIGGTASVVAEFPDTTADMIHFANRFVPKDKLRVIKETLRP